MANTVEDLYRDVLGRAPDSEGLAFWQNAFGNSVEPAEQASFMQSVQSVLSSVPAQEQAALAPKIVSEAVSSGVPVSQVVDSYTPEEEAPVTKASSQQKEGTSVQEAVNPKDPLVGLYQSVLGRTPSQAEINSWGFGDTIDQNELNRFLGSARNEAVTTMPKNTAASKLADQILGQNLTSKWKGEGFGSAEKNAYDMATILSSIGITNIKDFGKITTEVPAYDEEGNQIGTQKVETFGNKKTGQAVPNTYSERQTGDFFGGTFAGEGNTGYGVKFAPDGTPIFYTAGASSNDLANIMQDLGPLGNIAVAAIGGPWAVAAVAAASGKPIQDIVKSAALSYLGSEAGSLVSGTEGIADLLGETGTKIAANTARNVVASGGKLDPLDALLASGAGVGLNEILQQIPDFESLSPNIQNMIGKTVLSELMGGTSSPSGGTTGGTKTAGASGTTTGGTNVASTGGTNTANVANTIASILGSTATGGTKVSSASGGTGGTNVVKSTGGSNVSKGTSSTPSNVIGSIAGLLAGSSPKTATTNPAVDAVTNMAQQQSPEQNQQAALLNLLGSKQELANIKSYKDLYGHELFGDTYVPPSAGGAEAQGAEEEFFNGGHVDDLSVDALLHILRN
jgi:hypothetical protein